MPDSSASASSALRSLGRSSLVVTPLAWGMWRFRGDDLAAAQARVEAALEAGIGLFDTADVYGPDNGEPFGPRRGAGATVTSSPGEWYAVLVAARGEPLP